MMLQAHASRRSPRVRLPRTIPAVLRSQDGRRRHGELQMVSLTGGLICLPKPLDCRSRVKLRFVTHAGTIHGSAEMLKPVSWDLQPFRFVAIDGNDQRKLRATIELHLGRNSCGEEPIDTYRANPTHGTFFGNLLGYDLDGDDLLGVNRDPEQNCPICGVAGHNHTISMTKDCATKLLCGDDQTGKASEPKSNYPSRISPETRPSANRKGLNIARKST